MDGLEHFVSVQLVKNKQKQVNRKTRMVLLLFLPLLSSSITWIEYNYFWIRMEEKEVMQQRM